MLLSTSALDGRERRGVLGDPSRTYLVGSLVEHYNVKNTDLAVLLFSVYPSHASRGKMSHWQSYW